VQDRQGICGIGVRIGTTAYFLASATSANRVTDTLQAYGEDAGPGVFDLGVSDRIDISRPNDSDGSYWAPQFKQMVRHNIGLYQVYVRKLGFFLMPEGGYPNKVSAPLLTKKGAIKEDCFLLSYGHRQDGKKGIVAPVRYKNYVAVKRIKCKDDLCDMKTMRRRIEKDDEAGYLCGVFPELGAPVVYGYGQGKTVDYIVSEAKVSPRSNCTSEFKALEVRHGQEIIDRVAE
jgi:hypothetical protein